MSDELIMSLLLDIVNDVDRYTVAQRHRAGEVSRLLGTKKLTAEQAGQYLSDITNNHNVVLPK